jgi:murein DD-endopeptidase MepM/ murein hydrolase activator NlpD
MLENLYTTKMSESRKDLENRFSKILSKNGKFAKTAALLLGLILVVGIICVTVVMAVADGADTEINDVTEENVAITEVTYEAPESNEEDNVTVLTYPCDSDKITGKFGYNTNPFTNETVFHKGIDIVAEEGSNVYAATSGTVAEADYNAENGYYILIVDSNGEIQTKYAHLSAIEVEEGDIVESGNVIGKVGKTGNATGAHLHFEVHVNGEPCDPFAALPAEE